jgi:hypothetical protein
MVNSQYSSINSDRLCVIPISFNPLSALRRLLDDLDFVVRQAVQFANKLIDLLVRRVDLSLKGILLTRRLRPTPNPCAARASNQTDSTV